MKDKRALINRQKFDRFLTNIQNKLSNPFNDKNWIDIIKKFTIEFEILKFEFYLFTKLSTKPLFSAKYHQKKLIKKQKGFLFIDKDGLKSLGKITLKPKSGLQFDQKITYFNEKRKPPLFLTNWSRLTK